uniref:Reverse transcriptase zinc-binding domain-containing protein n=1 Tax=Cannabis sativa TaxID=3483 RepID=A0A803QNY4_CANSA
MSRLVSSELYCSKPGKRTVDEGGRGSGNGNGGGGSDNPNDLLVFCNGDFISVMLMLQGLKLFSSTSGLEPNVQKTSVYCSGMPEVEVNRILEASNFSRSTLPFRYLGIPICSKRLSRGECQELLEKMTGRIRMWSSRNLSYMGRTTLINSVLLAIHTYWAQISILPKKLLKDIEAVCRSFLWKGTQETSSPGLVAWDNICQTKSAGGLGFRNIKEWNVAAMGRYVWDIASKKDCLFVKWIHNVYLKNGNWWDYDPPMDCCWSWKKIVGVKNMLKQKVDVAGFVQQRHTIQHTYKILFEGRDKTSWSKIVWDRFIIPKHKFILWLVFWGRLNTKERIGKYNTTIDSTCFLCGQEEETSNHLFFECEYSRSCLQGLKNWLQWRSNTTNMQQLAKSFSKNKTMSAARRSVLKTALAGLVYHISKARNDVFWHQKLWHTRVIIQRVQQESKLRILGLPNKLADDDKQWLLGN